MERGGGTGTESPRLRCPEEVRDDADTLSPCWLSSSSLSPRLSSSRKTPVLSLRPAGARGSFGNTFILSLCIGSVSPSYPFLCLFRNRSVRGMRGVALRCVVLWRWGVKAGGSGRAVRAKRVCTDQQTVRSAICTTRTRVQRCASTRGYTVYNWQCGTRETTVSRAPRPRTPLFPLDTCARTCLMCR